MDKEKYIERFIEVCGTDSPTEIAELLNISSSAANNYLAGRIPDGRILINIAKKTPYSIHWLIMGEGAKFANEEINKALKMLMDDLSHLTNSDFLFEFAKFLREYRVKNGQTPPDPPKTVKLTLDKVREEKTTEDESSEKQEESSDVILDPS